MTQVGVGLVQAVSYLEKGEPDPYFSLVLDEVVTSLERGNMLSAALARSGAFDTLFVQLVVVGESHGALVETFARIAVVAENQARRRKALTSALTYPAFLLTVMLAVGLLFVFLIAPGDSGLIKVLGEDVPAPTRLLIFTLNLLTSPYFLGASLLALAVAGLVLRRIYSASKDLRLQLDEFLRSMPVLGGLQTSLDIARALDVVSNSMQVGLDVLKSLQLGANVCQNRANRRDLRNAIQSVTRGMGLAESLQEHTCFPPMVVQLMQVGELSGRLSEMAGQVARMMSEDVERRLDTALKLVEPILLSAGGMVACFVAVAAFMPIMKMVSTFGA